MRIQQIGKKSSPIERLSSPNAPGFSKVLGFSKVPGFSKALAGRKSRLYFGIALLLLILGLGNLVFGNLRQQEYAHVLRASKREFVNTTPKGILPMFLTSPTRDLQGAQLRRIRSRMSFYSLVTLGGECIIVVALTFSILGMLSAISSGTGRNKTSP